MRNETHDWNHAPVTAAKKKKAGKKKAAKKAGKKKAAKKKAGKKKASKKKAAAIASGRVGRAGNEKTAIGLGEAGKSGAKSPKRGR